MHAHGAAGTRGARSVDGSSGGGCARYSARLGFLFGAHMFRLACEVQTLAEGSCGWQGHRWVLIHGGQSAIHRDIELQQ